MFAALRITHWSQAQELAERLMLWGFRGQENSAWDLDTKLHRVARAFPHQMGMLWHREYWMLRQFQRRAHHHCRYLPEEGEHLDWLALMQHYGAPTRLLDFSHSFYVAAFFALDATSSDCAVWAVNWNKLSGIVAKHCNVDTSHENIDMANQRHISFVNAHIYSIGEKRALESPLVVHVEPERLHERLLIQQGFFLFPCTIERNFLELLATTFGLASVEPTETAELMVGSSYQYPDDIGAYSLLKIVLAKSLRRDALRDLFRMNISAATLFPGLDGFARSMSYYLND